GRYPHAARVLEGARVEAPPRAPRGASGRPRLLARAGRRLQPRGAALPEVRPVEVRRLGCRAPEGSRGSQCVESSAVRSDDAAKGSMNCTPSSTRPGAKSWVRMTWI